MRTKLPILFITLLIVLVLTAPILATSHDFTWEQPDNKHDLNEDDYNLMWSLDTDSPVDANTDTLSKAIANETDYAYKTPPTHPETWNSKELTTFDTSKGTSVHPPTINTTDGHVIKDAYVAIPALEHSSILHENADTTKLLTPTDGNVYTITDYRVDIPDDEEDEYKRVTYNYKDSRIKETELTVRNGVGSESHDDSHTSKLEYTNAAEGDTTLTVDVTIAASYTKKVERKQTVKENPTCIRYCETKTIYVTTQQYTVDREHTVNRSIDAHAYNPDMTVKYRNQNNGESTAQFSLPKYWTAVELPNGDRINAPIDTYTQRNTAWDSVVDSTATGTSNEYQSPITPVEVHAFPNKNKATIDTNPDSNIKNNIEITDQSGTTRSTPTLPDTIDFTPANGNEEYLSPMTIEIRTKQPLTEDSADAAFDIYGVTPNNKQTVSGTQLNNPIETTLNMTITNVDAQNKTITVDISLFETDTNNPIETANSDGYITVSPTNTTVQTDSNGNASVTIDYDKTQSYIAATYHSKSGFEENEHDTAEDKVMIRDPIIDFNGVFGVLWTYFIILAPMITVYYIFHRTAPNIFPWPR